MRDTGLSAFNFVKGENTKLKSVNCEWFACRDSELYNFLCYIRDFQLILTGVNNQVSYRAKRLILRSNILSSIREQTGMARLWGAIN